MELFPAADEEQFTYIKKLIDESDYYVVIIAGRYGSLADDGLSYTEKEYDYAIEKKIPVLAFLHKDPKKIPSEFTDPENARKLTAFRKKIESSKRLVKYWTTADNLRADVQTALFHAFESKPRTGWVRADSSQDTSQLKKQLDEAMRINDEKQKDIDKVLKECERLKAELEKSKEHESGLEMKLAELEKSISALQTQLDESRETEKSLRRQLAQATRNSDTLPPKDEPPIKNGIFTIGRWNDKPLEWLVLDVLPDRALLIAKDCLLLAPYNKELENVKWEGCSLRKEVLPQLLLQIFDDDKERDRVLLWKNRNPDSPQYGTWGGDDTDDKLFILSIDEAMQYFPNDGDRIARLNGDTVWWWLRSPGDNSHGAAHVNIGGSVYVRGLPVSWSIGAVRPSFWLNLES